MPIFVAQTARYAMMREVATCKVGFSAEYVRFQTGRQEITVLTTGRERAPQQCVNPYLRWLAAKNRTLLPNPDAVCPVFFTAEKETPGIVYGFSVARQLKLKGGV